MAVSVSIRNTFFHFEDPDSECDGSDEQPSVLRAVTHPAYLCREKDTCELEVTTGNECVDQMKSIATQGQEFIQAPVLLGRIPRCSAREQVAKGASQKTSTSDLTKGESLSRPSEAEWTTLMIRNLPSQYTREDFVSLLIDRGFAGRFDFVYFPVDFETHAGMGYAFVNMVSPGDARRLWENLDGFSTWHRPCKKVCRISWSQPLQGLGVHVARYRNSPLMHELVPESYRPLLFTDGMRVSFPPPTKKIKAPRKGNQRMLVPQN